MNIIRFADFQWAAWSRRTNISFNDVGEVAARDADGGLVPVTVVPLKLTAIEAARLVQPYVSVRFMEQVRAVVPLAAYLALFKLLILDHVVSDAWTLTFGLFAVIVGLMFFMEGLKVGLMPLGTLIGSSLPRQSPLPLVLLITLLLGVGVTFAEPAIGALKTAGANVSVHAAPYLFALLNEWSDALVLWSESQSDSLPWWGPCGSSTAGA